MTANFSEAKESYAPKRRFITTEYVWFSLIFQDWVKTGMAACAVRGGAWGGKLSACVCQLT